MKYTKEILTEAVKKSISMAQTIRNLGLKEAGGTYMHIKRKIISFNIDTSHFLGQRHWIGKKSKLRKKAIDILIKRNSGKRCPAYLLRRALLEIKRDYICEICGMKPLWNGKELRFHIDHKNGDWLDDRQENIRFVCPNCHSQTEGYNGSKNLSDIDTLLRHNRKYRMKNKEEINKRRRLKRNSVKKYCLKCNSKIGYKNKTGFCKSCLPQDIKKRELPDKKELETLIYEIPMTKIGLKYGVSDNAIRIWAKKLNILLPNHLGFWTPSKKVPLKEELENELSKQTITKVANLYKVSRKTIARWIKKLGIRESTRVGGLELTVDQPPSGQISSNLISPI